MKNWKKVLILGVALLIIAGIVVVALKGFKPYLMYGKHESIELNINKDIDLNAVKNICKEIFGDRKIVVKEVEMFNDSFQLNIEYITDEEKDRLVSKINEVFETEKNVEDLRITSIPKIRIRDSIKLYIKPMIIVYAISYVYIILRFRKNEPFKIILKNLYQTVLTEASLTSIIAIARIPIFNSIFFILAMIAIGELTYCISKLEKHGENAQVEKK